MSGGQGPGTFLKDVMGLNKIAKRGGNVGRGAAKVVQSPTCRICVRALANPLSGFRKRIRHAAQ